MGANYDLSFFIMLSILVLVHEFGHFVVAKRSGIKVEEFGLGYPPRLLTVWKHGDTAYTMNAIPVRRLRAHARRG